MDRILAERSQAVYRWSNFMAGSVVGSGWLQESIALPIRWNGHITDGNHFSTTFSRLTRCSTMVYFLYQNGF